MGPGEGGAAGGLALVRDWRGVRTEVDAVLDGGRGEGLGEGFGFGLFAAHAGDGDFGVTPVNAGVAGLEDGEGGGGKETESMEDAVAFE